MAEPIHEGATPHSGSLSGMSGSSSRGWEIVPSIKHLEHLRLREADSEFWGAFLIEGTVNILVGEASAGKTVFTKRLAKALADGKEFLGLMPPRPLRVLHIDLETPEALQRDHLETIGASENWFFARVDPSQIHAMLGAVAPDYDVIIVDSLQVASPVKDENSNAEANSQITPFVVIARLSKAAIILTHNAGEGNPKEKYKARGASARVDRADQVHNLDDVGPGKRRLKVVKSRFGNLDETIEFAFGEGLNYTLTKPAAGVPSTKQDGLARLVLEAMAKLGEPSTEVSRKEIARGVNIDAQNDTAMKRLDRVLSDLVEDTRLAHMNRGMYALTGGQEQSDKLDKLPDRGKDAEKADGGDAPYSFRLDNTAAEEAEKSMGTTSSGRKAGAR
jgi:hypothetical protein